MEMRDEEVLITRETMRQLLSGLRTSLTVKEHDGLPAAIRAICRDVNPRHETWPINQLMVALYIFPNSVQLIKSDLLFFVLHVLLN